ncbi:MAG TPA: ATP-binding protein [Puia sp.]|nr:ATP-binding protein [Puia sp.]
MRDGAEDAMETTSGWKSIGTVVGNAGTGEFTFILKQFKARVGDIVALGMDMPDVAYSGRSRIYVWARITDIHRFNPFFPFEAAQEIAGEGISLEDTILSGTRDQLEASALILGATAGSDLSNLFPLTYPVKPASTVWHPPAEAIRELLVGGREAQKSALIGSLIARNDVGVTLSASKLVARHMAILAMTGGGKTVAARRIIRELIGHNYPLFILDPHGDYIGLVKCQEKLKKESPNCTIRLFYPALLIQKDGEQLVLKLISQMTDGLSESQTNYLLGLFDRFRASDGQEALSYIDLLNQKIAVDLTNGNNVPGVTAGNWRPTVGAVGRSLRMVREKLQRMRITSEKMRASPKLKDLPFEALPNPFSQPDKIIRPGQVSILYLGGYDHITQCSIAAITLEVLFEFRTSLSGMIPPFLTVVEEAHTFIPSSREGSTQDAVSLPVIRRIITEGRKFGTGLMLISQRPSRLDETIVSQCNSFLILRLVNPNDQRFVRTIMENLTEADARMIPNFGPGQGIISGQVVRFPLPVSVQMDDDLMVSEISDEDFFGQVAEWQPDKHAAARSDIARSMTSVNQKKRRQPAKAVKAAKKKKR